MKRALAVGVVASLPGMAEANLGGALHGGGNSSDPSDTVGNVYLRRQQAYKLRVDAAMAELRRPVQRHANNGDECLYSNRIGNFTKGLPHDDLGEVDPNAYKIYLCALASKRPEDFENIPLGCTDPGYAQFVNPQSGLAFDLEGADAYALTQPPAPALASAQETAEILELYWMALARDIAFRDYGSNSLTQAAAADLSRLSDFRGPKVNGNVTPQTLFRDPIPGCLLGPYVSQFRWLPMPYGAGAVENRITTTTAGKDFVTDPGEWLRIQNGCPPAEAQLYDPTVRYIRNGRDAGQFVHVDVLHQAYYQALLITLALNCPLNPGNPYLYSKNQQGFGTFGDPHISTLMPEVGSRALHAVWFQKWFVHRRLRPEAFGGLIHNQVVNNAPYPVWNSELSQSTVWNYLTQRFPGSYLLPQAYAEGCPLHPSYGAGHATVAGACVTILKAWFDGTQKMADVLAHGGMQLVQATSDGLNLEPYTEADASQITVEGELNKLACNVATSRNIAGVHWRTDAMASLQLGEAIAISILQDQKNTYNENFQGFTFTKFDGTQITV